MRRSIISLVLLIPLAAVAIGCAEQRNGVDRAALPREVSDALDRAAQVYAQPLNGAQWSKVHVLKGTDHPVYQLRGINDRGIRIEIEVTSAGRVVEVEERGITSGEVPAPVMESLKARMPGFQPTMIEAVYQMQESRPVAFGFEGKDASGNELEIYIAADGRTILN